MQSFDVCGAAELRAGKNFHEVRSGSGSRKDFRRSQHSRKDNNTLRDGELDNIQYESGRGEKLGPCVKAAARHFELEQIGADDHFRKGLFDVSNHINRARRSHADFRDRYAPAVQRLCGETRFVSRRFGVCGPDGRHDTDFFDPLADVRFAQAHVGIIAVSP